MMRDNALAASGLINSELGGRSIKPYQPDGLWRINSATYQPDSGAIVYKRSVYVLIKRSVPNPTLGTFDATFAEFLHRSATEDQHASAGAGYPQRPHVCRGRQGTGRTNDLGKTIRCRP